MVGLDVGTATDQTQLGPMVDQLQRRYGRAPDEDLVDGGYPNLPELERLAGPAIGTTGFMPVPRPRNGAARDPHRPRRGDPVAVADWRIRMGTDEAKAIYRERAAAAECVNAIARKPRPAGVPGPGPAQGPRRPSVVRAGPQPHARGQSPSCSRRDVILTGPVGHYPRRRTTLASPSSRAPRAPRPHLRVGPTGHPTVPPRRRPTEGFVHNLRAARAPPRPRRPPR